MWSRHFDNAAQVGLLNGWLASVQGPAFGNHRDKGQTLGSKFGHAGFKFRLWGLPWWFSGKESTLPMQETSV